MKQIEIKNLLNPNFRHKIFVPIGSGDNNNNDIVGNKTTLLDKLKQILRKEQKLHSSDLEKQQVFKTLLQLLDDYNDKSNNIPLFYWTYYFLLKINKALPKSNNISEYERDVFDLYEKDLVGFLPIFQVEKQQGYISYKNKYKNLERRLWEALKPLYNFISQLNESGDLKEHYTKKPEKQYNFLKRNYQSPAVFINIFNDQDFINENYWAKLWILDIEKMTLDEIWEKLPADIFDYILTDKTIGMIRSGWMDLGSLYNSFKPYIKSEAVSKQFAAFIKSEIMLSQPTLTAYGVYNKKVKYNVGKNTRALTQANLKNKLIRDWFKTVYLSTSGKLKNKI